MIDGVLLGAFTFLGGVVTGLLVATYFHVEQETMKTQLGEMIVQQQTRIDALQQYIADHSDTEASAEDLGWSQ
jgi:cell division protein FtsL